MRLAAILLLIAAVAPAFADIAADKSYLAGRWAVMPTKPKGDGCDDTQDVDQFLWEEYSIRFRSAGGTIHIIDDVDMDYDYPISLSRDGKVLRLTLQSAQPWDIVVEPISANVMRVRKASMPDAAHNRLYAFRCRPAKPK
jgi:hypothetical protein